MYSMNEPPDSNIQLAGLLKADGLTNLLVMLIYQASQLNIYEKTVSVSNGSVYG